MAGGLTAIEEAIVLVVKKYTEIHVAGHFWPEDDPLGVAGCLFNMGSEKQLMLEDELWPFTTDENLIGGVTDALWDYGCSFNYQVDHIPTPHEVATLLDK